MTVVTSVRNFLIIIYGHCLFQSAAVIQITNWIKDVLDSSFTILHLKKMFFLLLSDTFVLILSG